LQLVKRTAFGWGSTGAAYAKPRQGLVIHYDGSDQNLAGKPHASCVDYWRRTRKFHVGSNRQWVDIGYSFGACPHGFVFEGRGEGRAQAAQPGGNTTWYSVTLMSGPGEKPTPEQIEAVRELRAYLMDRGLGEAVKGHRDFYATSCPGDELYRLVRDGTFTKSPEVSTRTTIEEGDVSAKDVWTYEIPVEWGSKDNPEWQAKSILVNTGQRVRSLEAKVEELTAAVKALTDAMGAKAK
jgi:hypothetical protein